MNLTEVRKKAAELGIESAPLKRMKKAEIVHAIQSAEGHTSCYGTRADGCPHLMCCFMTDCYKEASGTKKGSRSAKKSPKPA